MQIDSTQLTGFAQAIFEKLGAAEEKARETAEHLVLSNLKGHDSHGVGMIPSYVASALRGGLKVNADAEVVTDKGAVLLVDGRYGFGQVVGRQAADLAIERAKSMGMACVGSRNNHHLGRIGTYAEHCVREGLISIHFVNVVGHPPFVSLWGGRDKRVQTNPFCCGVPTGDDPVILDMATSAIALGKVRVAGLKGEDVPPGCLFDAEGRPTNDPGVIASGGSLGPFGGHKGSGLAYICELLGGALAGEWTMQDESKQGQIRVAWHGFDRSVKDGLPRIESRQFVHRIPRFLSEHEFSHSEESTGHGAVWIFLPGGIHGKRHGFGLICFRGLTVQSPPRGDRCFVSLGLHARREQQKSQASDQGDAPCHGRSKEVEAVAKVGAHEQRCLAAVGNAHAFFQNPIGWKCGDFLEESLVIDVGYVDTQATFLRELKDALVGVAEVGGDFVLNVGFGFGVKLAHVDSREIHPAFVFEIVFQVAQEIHLLECGSQAAGVGQQSLVGVTVAKHEDVKAHQAHNLCGTHDVIVVPLTVVGGPIQIPFHGTEEQIDVLTIDVVLDERLGEGVQDGVAAHAVVQRPVGVVLEAAEHFRLLFAVKGIHDFIRVAHKTVDVVDGFTK